MIIAILAGASLCAGAVNSYLEKKVIPEKHVNDWVNGKMELVPLVDANAFIPKRDRDRWGFMSSDERKRMLDIGEATADLIHEQLDEAERHAS